MARPGESFDGDDFLLPDLGEGLEEAEVVEWLVEEGQNVEDGDPLALIETGKAQTEVYAPRSGTITRRHGKTGDMIKVGSPFVSYGEAGKDKQAEEKSIVSAKPAIADSGDVFADEGDAEGENAEAEQRKAAREDAGTVVGQFQALAGVGSEGGKPLAAPAVRRMARDAGIDLADVAGTGIGGRITEADVRAAIGSRPATKARTSPNGKMGTNGQHAPPPRDEPAVPIAPPTRVPGEDVARIPFRGVRRTIANRLRESVDRAVHFTVMDEADVSRLDSMRRKLIAATGEKISLLPFVCVALARVLSGEFGYEMQRLNSTTDDKAGEILQHGRVHLGLAVDTSSGLMVPVLRDANRMGVMEVGRRIAELAAACRDRSIPQQDLAGSTFSVSNFGSYAGRFATPVINYPETGILAVGRMREGVIVKDGLMGVGKLLPLSLTCDHRVIDGGTATLALNAVINLLQDPNLLLPEEVRS